MKPSENTHKVKQTQILISSSFWAPGLCVLSGVMCHERSRDMCDASRVWSWHPGTTAVSTKSLNCNIVSVRHPSWGQSRNIEVTDYPWHQKISLATRLRTLVKIFRDGSLRAGVAHISQDYGWDNTQHLSQIILNTKNGVIIYFNHPGVSCSCQMGLEKQNDSWKNHREVGLG